MDSSKPRFREDEKAKGLLELNQWFFVGLLLAFLLLFLVELIWEGSISGDLNAHYFNMILIVAIISGVALLLTPVGRGEPIEGRGYFLIAVAGIATSAIVSYKLQGLGWVSYPMAIASGIAVVLLCIAILRERMD